MPTKLVFKISMNDQKSRSKALKTIVGVPGVESASLGEDDKSKIEVEGEGVDAANLTNILRKKLTKGGSMLTCWVPINNKGHVELISVGEAKSKEKENETKIQPVVWSYDYSTPQYPIYRDYI